MRIEFVNHACYILETGSVRLMTDPWLEGTAFHNGWGLIEPSRFDYQRFEEITHIWFSHEHPDHFSPQVLKKIPEASRARITVLFQRTKDRKVVDFCRKLGFGEVRELSTRWETIAPQVEVMNRPHTDGDSWLCLRAEGLTILNVNDCNLETDAEVKAIATAIGSKPDLLFTQFSYANAMGNSSDTAIRAAFAKAKIDEIYRQIRILKPRYVIPFASFVWFCHRENFFRNDAVNTVKKVSEAIGATEARPVVMFNGDTWEVGTTWDNSRSSAIWEERYLTRISIDNAMEAPMVEASALIDQAREFIQSLKRKNSYFIHYWLKPSLIYVRDLNRCFELSLSGLREAETSPDNCDIALSSEVLYYCFKFEWGGSTTRINGRYEVPPGGKFVNFKRYFLISSLNNQGKSLGPGTGVSHVLKSLKSKVFPAR